MRLQEKRLDLGEDQIIFETGRYCEQADACVTVRMGETLVMATVTTGDVREGIDYFPLSVNYEEKLYAAGKIKTSRFMKREGRPSDESILKARLIDRSIRPLFPKEYRKDVQIMVTILSYDRTNRPEILGALGTFAALTISAIPWNGPLGCVRIGQGDDGFLVNPTTEQMESSDLDLILSGTGERILMLEAGMNEIDEKTTLDAMEQALESLGKIAGFMTELRDEWGEEKIVVKEESKDLGLQEKYEGKSKELISDFLRKFGAGEITRHDFASVVIDKILEGIDEEDDIAAIKELVDSEYKKAMREQILKQQTRPDGRKLDEVRTLSIEAGLIPRVHGSSLFKRGETQVLNIATLGSPSAELLIEDIEGQKTKKFFHHYTAPPYSVGETGRIGSPGRREIGHGALAEKAIMPVLPSQEDFPYTIRLVSEVMSQNGSTSMASTCASILTLMDAGVTIKRPVAGVAMGLITDKESEAFCILTDIAGVEDFGGDMDFKVTGSREGITAIQMDTKIHGITIEITRETLERAKQGRLFILDAMEKVITAPRPTLSEYAPKIASISIDPEFIGKIIGTGGSVIRGLSQDHDVQIDIDDSGTVTITSESAKGIEDVTKIIKGMTAKPEVGEIYDGKVTRILDFGAFIEIFPGTEGLVHISKLAKEHIDKPEDVVSVGDAVKVKLLEIDNMGRLNLTMNLDDQPGSSSRPGPSSRGPRDRDSRGGSNRGRDSRGGGSRDGGYRGRDSRGGGSRDGGGYRGDRQGGSRPGGQRDGGQRTDDSRRRD